MRAWRVHDVGEPEDVFVLEDVDEPTAARLAEMGMSMGGWVPLDEAPYKVTPEFAIVDMRAAALTLPDATMARGTYPVPVPHPYISVRCRQRRLPQWDDRAVRGRPCDLRSVPA